MQNLDIYGDRRGDAGDRRQDEVTFLPPSSRVLKSARKSNNRSAARRLQAARDKMRDAMPKRLAERRIPCFWLSRQAGQDQKVAGWHQSHRRSTPRLLRAKPTPNRGKSWRVACRRQSRDLAVARSGLKVNGAGHWPDPSAT